MSNQIDDGGQGIMDAKGMPLRDWFAGMALQGMMASGRYFHESDSGESPEPIRYEPFEEHGKYSKYRTAAAEDAYGYADDMLKARKEDDQ